MLMTLFYPTVLVFKLVGENANMSDLLPIDRYREFAAERSHNDAQAAIETARATAQALLWINGGAATALLVYLPKDTSHPRWLVAVVLGYALGVLAAVVSNYFRTLALSSTTVGWLIEAFPGIVFPQIQGSPTGRSQEAIGQRQFFVANWSAIFSGLCFFGTSAIICVGLVRPDFLPNLLPSIFRS